jgi:uncharacterized protein YjbI with pentapeptide repeats
MKLRKCDFTGSNFSNVKMEHIRVPTQYKTLPDVGEHEGREARTTPLVPLEYLKELRPVELPNPPAALNKTNLSETRWKRTFLNRVDADKKVSPSFVFEGANLSNADFSKAVVIHPVTKEAMGMGQIVMLAKTR